MFQRRTFSLVELLVVISILAMIMSILFPTLNRAVYKADTLNCSQNIKNLTTTFFLYSDDYEGYYPSDRGHHDDKGDPTYMGFTKSGSTPRMEVVLESYFVDKLRYSDYFICPVAAAALYDGDRNNHDGVHNGELINHTARISGHFVTQKDSNNRHHFRAQYMFLFDFYSPDEQFVGERTQIGDELASADENAYRTLITDFHTNLSFGKVPPHYESTFEYGGNNSAFMNVKLNSFYSTMGGGNNYGSDDGSVAIVETYSPWQYNDEVEPPYGKWRFKKNGSKWYEYNRSNFSQWRQMGKMVVPLDHKIR